MGQLELAAVRSGETFAVAFGNKHGNHIKALNNGLCFCDFGLLLEGSPVVNRSS